MVVDNARPRDVAQRNIATESPYGPRWNNAASFGLLKGYKAYLITRGAYNTWIFRAIAFFTFQNRNVRFSQKSNSICSANDRNQKRVRNRINSSVL